MDLSAIIFFTIILGFVPPILWLWFWLKEDVHPEPKREITLVFCIGMAAVLAAFLVQTAFAFFNKSVQEVLSFGDSARLLINIAGFAFIEELAKTSAAFATALRSRYFDEPVDAMIYVITAALGFAALENALFVSQGLGAEFQKTLAVSSFRFVSAVLIHASTGAIIGAAFAFSFCDRKRRVVELGVALLLATALHAYYNFLILSGALYPKNQIAGAAVAAGSAVVALILFERAKRLRAQCETLEQKATQ